MHGVYFYFTLEVLLRFLLVVGMAFGTLAAYFVIVAEWFAKSPADKTELGKLAPLYLLGALIYGHRRIGLCFDGFTKRAAPPGFSSPA